MATDTKPGRKELMAGLRPSSGLFSLVGLLSFFTNILMLTGSIFMLQIYDRVLPSRSEATLLGLAVLMIMLYLLMGVMDNARGRIMARIGARFQDQFDKRVFEATMRRSLDPVARSKPSTGLKDLEAVQKLLSSPALFAVFDLPWTPVFFAAIFLFHTSLGYIALAGGAMLICATFLNQILSRKPQTEALKMAGASENFSESIRRDSEVVQSLGMRGSVLGRWQRLRSEALAGHIKTTDITGSLSTFSKTFRFILQSIMLAGGAYLVLQFEMSPGEMIAGSILLGRALAPVELAIQQWPLVQRAQTGWSGLIDLLSEVPPEPERTALPRPKAILEAKDVTIVPPGERVPTLRMVNFRLEPGQALGVIGASGAGKSTLARAITGLWRPASGKVRLDGAALDQYDPDVLGGHIGYLPQDVSLFNASVADNIARMALQPDPAKVVEAAKKAGAHDMILKLPQGYDTVITQGGGRLSGGQKQRLGLARAMYGDPVLLVLDEPNSNLDTEGSAALNDAIRTTKDAGHSVVIMAHRPAAIAACDLLLLMENGTVKAFGPRDEVLKAHLKNYEQVANSLGGAAKIPQRGAATGAGQRMPAPQAMQPGASMLNPQQQSPLPQGMPTGGAKTPAKSQMPQAATSPAKTAQAKPAAAQANPAKPATPQAATATKPQMMKRPTASFAKSGSATASAKKTPTKPSGETS